MWTRADALVAQGRVEEALVEYEHALKIDGNILSMEARKGFHSWGSIVTRRPGKRVRFRVEARSNGRYDLEQQGQGGIARSGRGDRFAGVRRVHPLGAEVPDLSIGHGQGP